MDITGEIQIEEKYDLVLCTNVLEHVYDTNLAIKNLKYLMKEKGHLVISVPFSFIHFMMNQKTIGDLQSTLSQLFSDFKILSLKRTGIRQFPIQYILLLEKIHKALGKQKDA